MGRALLGLALAAGLASQDDEAGFEPLFNGKDFAGMRFYLGRDGTADPAATFRVEDGVLFCTGRPAGYWYTEKKYKDFVLRFEYRYRRPAGEVDESRWAGNSGYLFYFSEHKVWPRSLEVQGMNRDVLGLIPIGGFKVKRVSEDREARARARRPLGEWNAVEIVSKDGRMTCSLNGTRISEFAEFEPFESPIAFQSEGAEIHWRRVRLKPL